MDYKKIYYSIINNALDRSILGYTELHHIIPKSFGGSNKKNNLVKLTAREHFLCHYLLCKMTIKGSKNWHSAIKAFNMMCANTSKQSRYINARLYESQRIHMSNTMSMLQKGSKNSQFNTCWINMDGTSKKISKQFLNDYISEGWNPGRVPAKIKKQKTLKILKRPQSSGSSNSQYGSIWINNGKINKKIKGSNIPTGWKKGRIMSMPCQGHHDKD